MISGKYILQTDFEEKNNSCKEIPGGKSFCIEEKYFSLLIVLEKKSYIVKLSMSVEKIISPEVWGRRFLTKPNHPSKVTTIV